MLRCCDVAMLMLMKLKVPAMHWEIYGAALSFPHRIMSAAEYSRPDVVPGISKKISEIPI